MSSIILILIPILVEPTVTHGLSRDKRHFGSGLQTLTPDLHHNKLNIFYRQKILSNANINKAADGCQPT